MSSIRFSLKSKALFATLLLLFCVANAQTTDETPAASCGSTIYPLYILPYTVLNPNWCSSCLADYTDATETTIQNTYGLQLRDSVDYTDGQYNNGPYSYTNPYRCFKNDGQAYACQVNNRVPYCELYDHFGRCIRCLCGYSFLPASFTPNPTTQTCVKNPQTIAYCDLQDTSQTCQKCKWNQYLSNDETSGFNINQHTILDFGYYPVQQSSGTINLCQDNTAGSSIIPNPVRNCRRYSSSYQCNLCHSRNYSLDSNVQWDANVYPQTVQAGASSSQLSAVQNQVIWPYFAFRKIHHDFYLSNSAGSLSCLQYPTGYSGFPAYLQTIAYQSGSSIYTNPSTMFNPYSSACTDFSGQGQTIIILNRCGHLYNDPFICPTPGDNYVYFCAPQILNCQVYNVLTINGSVDGSQNEMNYDLGSINRPLFLYNYANTCRTCNPSNSSYNIIPTSNGKQCIADPLASPAFPNCTLLNAAATTCILCNANYYLNNNNQCTNKTIILHSQCNVSTVPSAQQPTCLNCLYPYLINVDPTATASTQCNTLNSLTQYIYKPNLQNYIEWGCAASSYPNQTLNPAIQTCDTGLLTQYPNSNSSSYCFGADGFYLAQEYNILVGNPTSWRCGCADSFNTPLNWAFCQQTKNIPSSMSGCAILYSQNSSYCIACNAGYQLLPDGQCVQVAPDSTHCAAYTSTGNCRLCDTSNGYFLDYDTLTCMMGSLKVPNATNNATTEGLAGCLFGMLDKTKTPLSIFSYNCFQCALGFQLQTASYVNITTYYVQYCQPVNQDAQQLQNQGMLNYTYQSLNLTAGKWNCPSSSMSDVYVVDYIQYNAPTIPSFSTEFGPYEQPLQIAQPLTQCRTTIANCELYDAQFTNSCFLCRRQNSMQLGVIEPSNGKAAQCQACTQTNTGTPATSNIQIIGVSIEGKFVCVNNYYQNKNCYTYMLNSAQNYVCSECLPTYYLDVDNTCQSSCNGTATTTTVRSITTNLWNGYKIVLGCIYNDSMTPSTPGQPFNSFFVAPNSTGQITVSPPLVSTTTTVNAGNCLLYRNLNSSYTECVLCSNYNPTGQSSFSVLAPLSNLTTFTGATQWYCATLTTTVFDSVSTNYSLCDPTATAGCATLGSFTRINQFNPTSSQPAYPLRYNAIYNTLPCAPVSSSNAQSVFTNTNTNTNRHTAVIDTAYSNFYGQYILLPKCVPEAVSFYLNSNKTVKSIQISPTLLTVQDTYGNTIISQSSLTFGCASFDDQQTTPGPLSISAYTNSTAAPIDPTGRCCACQPDLHAFTSITASSPISSTSGSCNIQLCSRRIYQTSFTSSNCQTSIQANQAVQLSCAYCSPGYFLSINLGATTCTQISGAGYSKESFGCLQYASSSKCNACAWPLVLQNGGQLPNPCGYAVRNSIEVGGSQSKNPFKSNNTGCSWAYFQNMSGICAEKPYYCKQVVGQYNYATTGYHFDFLPYSDSSSASAATIFSLTSSYSQNNNFDALRVNCATCLDGQAPQQGICFPNCKRVKKTFDSINQVFTTSCCTCNLYYFLNTATGLCQACNGNCATCSAAGNCLSCVSTISNNIGYYLSGSSCITCNATDVTCTTFSTSTAPVKSGNICACSVCLSTLANPYYLSNGQCLPSTTDPNCIQYSATANLCQTCNIGYYLQNNPPNLNNQCAQYTLQNCLVKAAKQNTCSYCNTGYYLNSSSLCVFGTIQNCVQYVQSPSNQPKCYVCTRSVQNGNTPYGNFFALTFDSTACLAYQQNTVAQSVPYCFQYANDNTTCTACNNYASNPSAPYFENINGVRGIFAMVSNEQSNRMCQFMQYCVSALKTVDINYNYYYNCSQCLPLDENSNQVLQIYGPGYGKSAINSTNLQAFASDPKPQCVSSLNFQNPVTNCAMYYYDGSNVQVFSTTPVTAQANSQNCIACQNGYTPEVFNTATKTGGTFCKQQQLACNIAACKYYQQNTKYESLQCEECNATYSTLTYTLNSQSLKCDQQYAGFEVTPQMSVSYTGIDNSINSAYPPASTPTVARASVLSFALMSLFMAVFVLLA